MPLIYLYFLSLAACLTGVSLAFSGRTIHRHMSPDDLRRVFQVESHADVPEYEVVHVRSLSKRNAEDSRTVHLSAFGRNFQLNLRRNDQLLGNGRPLRMFTVEPTETNQVDYRELPQEGNDIGDIYQDENNEAALLLHHDIFDGALLLDGTIGSDLVVKPAPASIRKQVAVSDELDVDVDDDEAFLDDAESLKEEVAVSDGFPLRNAGSEVHLHYNGSRNSSSGEEGIRRIRRSSHTASTGVHIVYKRSTPEMFSDYAFMEPDHLPTFRDKRSVRKTREAPYVIYPEILVIVDYDGYRLHGGDNVQIKRYFVSFWNGVDLRYKLLKGPKIRISIAGIIISRGRDATPYLERNRVGRDAIDSAAALTDMGKYLFRERRLPVYDIAVAVTKYDMCRRRKGGRCTKGTAGFAYVGGACVVNKRLEKVNSVAIIEDTGGFSGIIVAAHEVGHLLGAVHDGSPPPSYLGGPGAEKCRWEDGFIMSDLRHTEKGFRWSPCSISSFNHFLNGDTATCLYNSPHEDESLPRVLPGKLLSLDAQCRKDRGTSACFKDDRVCAQLFCFDASSGYCVAYRPAAEGSPCGDGQYCISGRCVAEHENIIPDYTQITPSFLRRTDTLSSSTQSRPVYANPPTQTTKGNSANSTTQRSPWGHLWTRRTTPIQSTYSTTHRYIYSTTPRTTTRSTTRATTTQTPRTTTRSTYKNPYTYSTPPTRYQTTTKKTSLYAKTESVKDIDCEDKVTNISGSMSCKEFLTRYGFQYCSYHYIRKNCCASQKQVCVGR